MPNRRIVCLVLAVLVAKPSYSGDEDLENTSSSPNSFASTSRYTVKNCVQILGKKRFLVGGTTVVLSGLALVFFLQNDSESENDSELRQSLLLRALEGEGLSGEDLEKATRNYKKLEEAALNALRRKKVNRNDIKEQIRVVLPVIQNYLSNPKSNNTIGEDLACKSGDCDSLSIILGQILIRQNGEEFAKRMNLVLLPDREHAVLRIQRSNKSSLHIETTKQGGFFYEAPDPRKFTPLDRELKHAVNVDIREGRNLKLPFSTDAITALALETKGGQLIKSKDPNLVNMGQQFIKNASQIVQKNPSLTALEYRILENRVTAQFAQKKIKKAGKLSEQLVRRFPQFARSYFIRGLVLEKENSTAAKESFQTAILKNPYHMKARISLLKLMLRKGEIRQVEEEVSNTLDFSPELFMSEIVQDLQRFKTRQSQALAKIVLKANKQRN